MPTLESISALAVKVQTSAIALNEAIAAAQVENINVSLQISYAQSTPGSAPNPMNNPMQASGVSVSVSLPLPLPTVN